MNKYQVMLVDDEEDVIQVIIRKINWEALGYEVMGYAHNGLEALELCEERQPDVVMTDIKMPYMDGLALSRKLKEQYPAVKIIIFSGFDEFEYAKEAIRLEAEEYILKPIDADELSQVFRRIHESLDKEFDEKQNINMLKNYYLESLPILQENFYSSLIEGRIPEQSLQKEMLDYQVELTGPYYAVLVLHNSLSLAPEGINPLLLTVSIRKVAEERMQEEWRAKFFSYLGNIVCIVQLAAPSEVKRLTDACETLCRLVRHLTNATVTIGVGGVVSVLSALHQSYSGARDAVSYRVIYGRGKAINIAEIAPERHEEGEKHSLQSLYNDDALHELFKAVRIDSREKLDAAVEAYLREHTPENPSIQAYHFFVMELVTEIHKFLLANQIDPERIFPQEDIYRRVQQMALSEMGGWLKETLEKLQDIIQETRNDSTRSFVSRALDYVRDHYEDKELSIESICDYLNVSAAYFSTVFKRETGKTFINYLTDFRMEKAVRMLLEKNEKTYVIAQAVGYSDPNYFSYAFKKKYGMSPSKYRAAQLSGKDV